QGGLKLEDFYYVTRDTGDPKIGLRARAIYDVGEDPATGSAAGCTSAWMVKYGVAQPDETVLILQGVEAKRPSRLFVRSSKTGIGVSNVRVGGHAVQIMEGEASLQPLANSSSSNPFHADMVKRYSPAPAKKWKFPCCKHASSCP